MTSNRKGDDWRLKDAIDTKSASGYV